MPAAPRKPESKTADLLAQEHDVPVAEPVRPLAESELTPDQRRIRELEHQLALQQTQKFEKAPEELDESTGERSILIHVLKDGFTALDRVWYRGQEIEFPVPSRSYEGTKDRNGKSWLDFDAGEQVRRWGEQHFGYGPWPGLEYADDAAKEAERRRARRAPVLPQR